VEQRGTGQCCRIEGRAVEQAHRPGIAAQLWCDRQKQLIQQLVRYQIGREARAALAQHDPRAEAAPEHAQRLR
jgi:hypothetical protein